MMTSPPALLAGAERSRSRVSPRRRPPFAASLVLALAAAWVALAFVGSPVSRAAAGVDWDETKTMHTVDRDPGGSLQWDRPTGRVRVCDKEPDGHFVVGTVTVEGDEVVRLRAGENGKCYEAAIPGYKPTEEPKYNFQICLDFGPEWLPGHCNTSDNKQWPEVDREEGYCHNRPSTEERRECAGAEVAQEEGSVLEPPVAPTRSLSIDDRPDLDLSRGNPKDAGEVAEPAGVMLRWLLWTSLGGCVVGFLLVGGNMAIRHKRGEAGAHAVGFGWVVIACVAVGSGATVAFISLLLNPL